MCRETFPSHTSDHWGLNTERDGCGGTEKQYRRWKKTLTAGALRLQSQSRDVSPILSPPLFFIQAFVLSLIRRTAGYILSRRKKALLLPDDKEWERNRCCLHHYYQLHHHHQPLHINEFLIIFVWCTSHRLLHYVLFLTRLHRFSHVLLDSW